MIPKKIHYCWFGKKPLPKDVRNCIDSWKKYCPDYEIIRWDESNFDINCCEFVKDAYNNKAWAFVSDYARLKVIYDYGGIYLDTDVELIKNIDGVLNSDCYFALQQAGNYIATGLGFGAIKGMDILKEMMDVYDSIKFENDKREKFACPLLNTDVIKKYGKYNNEKISILNKNITIYPSKYFDPIAPGETEDLLCKDTYSIHHYSATWTNNTNRTKRRIINFIGQEKINKIKTITKKEIHKISKVEIFYYFVLISFLFPRGFLEYSIIYKNLFKIFTWSSVFFIWGQFFFKYFDRKINKKKIFLFSYFILAIILTIFVRKDLSSGLQQLFAFPSLCIFIIYNMKNNCKTLLNALNNILLLVFILNQVICRNFFAQQLHITFLGHVQMISQIGSLAIFSAILYWMMFNEKKYKIILLLIITAFTMITTDALSSLFTIIIFGIIGVVYIFKLKISKILELDTRIYVILGMLFSILIIGISINDKLVYDRGLTFLNFSGRSFIWKDAIQKFLKSPLFGYGIDGILLKPFWVKNSNSIGFNYVHNQIMQNLLDGGIILFGAFWYMIALCCVETKKIIDSKYKILINTIITAFLSIMVFESVTLYCYFFICLFIIYSLPNVIDKEITKKEIVKDGLNKQSKV